MTSNGPCTRMTRCFRVVDLWVSIFIFPSTDVFSFACFKFLFYLSANCKTIDVLHQSSIRPHLPVAVLKHFQAPLSQFGPTFLLQYRQYRAPQSSTFSVLDSSL